VRVGVIGQGRWGTRLAAALRASPAFRVDAVCDVRADRLRPESPERVTHRVDDVLGMGLEAVVIATDPASHADLAVASLETGHHVLVEKPCALSVEGAERIRLASVQAERVVGVGHLLRYHAAYERLVELVRSGALGTICGAVAERVGSRPRQDVDAWWMLAPHDLSVLFAMFGEPDFVTRRWRTGDDEFVATVRFGDAPATLLARSGGAPSRRFAVMGSHTTAVIDELEAPLQLRLVATLAQELRPLVSVVKDAASGQRSSASAMSAALDAASMATQELILVPQSASPLERELDAFASAIRHGVPLATDANEGAAVVRMLDTQARDRSASVSGPMEAPVALEP
jgi:predicted dehydrogenase